MRHSPIHAWLTARQPEWSKVGETPVAVRFQAAGAEQTALQTLALCDLSALTKLGLKGSGSANWLQDQGVDVPQDIYQSLRLADGGFVVKLGNDEFLLESGIANECVPALTTQLDSPSGHIYAISRQEATFLLAGSRSREVLAQTCSIDFGQTPPHQLVMTRVAGTSCSVLPDPLATGVWACRLWVDCSYAIYVWEQLVEISDSLGGTVIGAGCVYPELRQ